MPDRYTASLIPEICNMGFIPMQFTLVLEASPLNIWIIILFFRISK